MKNKSIVYSAEKVISLNTILENYCKENNIKYVDYYSKMNDGNGGLKVPEFTSEDDLVHPNKQGYSVMAVSYTHLRAHET